MKPGSSLMTGFSRPSTKIGMCRTAGCCCSHGCCCWCCCGCSVLGTDGSDADVDRLCSLFSARLPRGILVFRFGLWLWLKCFGGSECALVTLGLELSLLLDDAGRSAVLLCDVYLCFSPGLCFSWNTRIGMDSSLVTLEPPDDFRGTSICSGKLLRKPGDAARNSSKLGRFWNEYKDENFLFANGFSLTISCCILLD